MRARVLWVPRGGSSNRSGGRCGTTPAGRCRWGGCSCFGRPSVALWPSGEARGQKFGPGVVLAFVSSYSIAPHCALAFLSSHSIAPRGPEVLCDGNPQHDSDALFGGEVGFLFCVGS